MCAEDNKTAATIVEKIKQLLLNYDLTIAYANGEIAIRKATMELYKGSKNKYQQKKFIEAKVDKERFEIFIEDVNHAKQEISENVSLILDKYQPRYKQIFIAYFLEGKNYDDICELTHYSKDAINKIIHKLKQDLLTFYMP